MLQVGQVALQVLDLLRVRRRQVEDLQARLQRALLGTARLGLGLVRVDDLEGLVAGQAGAVGQGGLGRLARLRGVAAEGVQRVLQVLLHVLLAARQHGRHLIQHGLELLPVRAQRRQELRLLLRHHHVELGEGLVPRLQRVEPPLRIVDLRLRSAQQVEAVAELVQGRGLAAQCRRGVGHVVPQLEQLRLGVAVQQARQVALPLLAVVDEGSLEQRAVDLDEVHRLVHVLALHDVNLRIAIARDVDVELHQRAPGLGVATDEVVLVRLPQVLVLVPVAQVLLQLRRRRAHAVHDGHQNVQDVLVVGHHVVERRQRVALLAPVHVHLPVRVGVRVAGPQRTRRGAVAVDLRFEYLTQAGHHRDDGDELLAHDVGHLRQGDHGRLELHAVALQHHVDLEQRLRVVLGVAVDGARQLVQGLAHGLAQAVLHALVRLLGEHGPLTLHVHRVLPEVLVHLLHDALGAVVALQELRAHPLAVARLLGLEHAVLVHQVLHDVDEQGGGDRLAVAADALLVGLELQHQSIGLRAVAAAFLDVPLDDALAGPGQLVQPGADAAVEAADDLGEQLALLRRQLQDDLVVVLHHQQHVLAQDAELLLLVGDVVGDVGDLHLALELAPEVHLLEQAQEALVEVALQQPGAGAGDETRLVDACLVPSQHAWLRCRHADDERVVQARRQLRLVQLVKFRQPVAVALADVLLQHLHEGVVLQLRLLRVAVAGEVVRLRQVRPVSLQLAHEAARPQGAAGEARVVRRQRRVGAVGLEVVLGGGDLRLEQHEHQQRAVLHGALDRGALREGVERLQQLDVGLDGAHALERASDDVAHHDLQVLHPVLEVVEVVVPLRGLDVQDRVAQQAELVDVAPEAVVDAVQGLGDLRAAGPAKGRQGRLLAAWQGLARELDLAFAHLQQVPAALHERVDLREDVRLAEAPRAGLRECRRVLDGLRGAVVGVLPRTAARNALVEPRHGVKHITVEDVVQGDVGAAAVDDLVGHLAQQARQALWRRVLARHGADDADAVQQAGQDGGDVLRRRSRQLLARLREDVEEAQVVLRLHAAGADELCQLLEGRQERRLCRREDSHDLAHALAVQLLLDAAQVHRAAAPEVDFLQRACRLGVMRVVFVVHHLART